MTSPAASLQYWFGRELDDVAIGDLRLDSRQVCANDVFFSLSAERDASAHIAQAIANGAAAVVVDAMHMNVAPVAVPVLPVENLRQQLGAMAHIYYGQPSMHCKLVGITGTNGKTSCSHWLAQAWQMLSGTAGTIGTLGCGLINVSHRQETGMTTPDVLSNHRLIAAMLKEKTQMVAMEVSSHALDQGRVDGLQFDTAVFTNLTRDHLDYHGDMNAYAAAKKALFDREELKFAVVNVDDGFGKELSGALRKSRVSLLTYAIDNQAADLGVERWDITGRGIHASIRTPWGRGALQSRFPGGYNLLNVLAVVATLCGHGMSLQSVLGAVEQLQAVPGRTQIVSSDHDDILVVVDYAHTPDALQKILAALREQAKGVLWCVFGCGGNRDRGKRPQMAAAALAAADAVIVTSDNPRDENPQTIINEIISGLSSSAIAVIVDRSAAIASAIQHAKAGDVILLAGKGHETYQEVAGKRLPFSDIEQAHAALSLRRQLQSECAI